MDTGLRDAAVAVVVVNADVVLMAGLALICMSPFSCRLNMHALIIAHASISAAPSTANAKP
jgi:hypothetical protein